MPTNTIETQKKPGLLKNIARVLLGIMLALIGVGHLTWARAEFQAQVPEWVPLNADLVVILSGIVEIVLGLSLLFLSRQRKFAGWATAVFFVLVFPGNIAQYVNHTDAFGLNTDAARAVRLAFQPVLIFWALWSTEAWKRNK